MKTIGQRGDAHSLVLVLVTLVSVVAAGFYVYQRSSTVNLSAENVMKGHKPK